MNKILIVDDNSRRATFINKALKQNSSVLGGLVDIVGDVNSAKKKLYNFKYDLLIIDVILPIRQGESAHPANGISLLNYATNKNKRIFIPKNIIGITASKDDLLGFRVEFEKKCSVVFGTDDDSGDWLKAIDDFLLRIDAAVDSAAQKNIALITVHGIRTYGQWQNVLENKIKMTTDRVQLFHYKYGYFSAIEFLISSLREKQIEKFSEDLMKISDRINGCECTIVAHSFGTYIAVNALKRLVSAGHDIKIKNLILCGCILRERFEWTDFNKASIGRIINDCGYRDFPLCLSKIFIPDTGLSGRVGFLGLLDELVVNRFFNGGHSIFFSGDKSFFDKHWIPIIVDGEIKSIDDRSSSSLNGTIESAVCFIAGHRKCSLAGFFLLCISIYYFVRVLI